jgi:glycopeptide antibiotics resistance protein
MNPTPMKERTSPPQGSRRWANRILVSSLIGIVCLTLFPFRLDFSEFHSLHRSPFLLGESLKYVARLDFFLNVLLFVPFGAGIAAQMRNRGVSRSVALIVALVAGAFTSYTVEFLQLFIPMRDSGWNDIISNSMGSVTGFLLFELCGELLLKPMTSLERSVESWLSFWGTCGFLLVYLGFFFILSVPLQKQTRLNDWDPAASLFVGSDGTARYAWKGQIAKLEIWNRALPDEFARKLTSGDVAPESESGLVASYEFIGAPPYGDRQQFSPKLTWISSTDPPPDSRGLNLDGKSWLSTIVPVQDLTRELTRTNQFSIRAVCAPADVADFDLDIISLTQSSGLANLTLRQDGPDLFLWVRNPLTEKHTGGRRHAREIYVSNLFAAGQMRDILVSYDGSDVSLYVDGKKQPRVYSFSPGAALLPMLVRFKGSDWGGDLVMYDALIFIPAGMFLGMIGRKVSWRNPAGRFLWLLGLALPSALYEFILVWVSGRVVSFWQVSLCLFLTFLGASLVNADQDSSLIDFFRYRKMELAK